MRAESLGRLMLKCGMGVVERGENRTGCRGVTLMKTAEVIN